MTMKYSGSDKAGWLYTPAVYNGGTIRGTETVARSSDYKHLQCLAAGGRKGGGGARPSVPRTTPAPQSRHCPGLAVEALCMSVFLLGVVLVDFFFFF